MKPIRCYISTTSSWTLHGYSALDIKIDIVHSRFVTLRGWYLAADYRTTQLTGTVNESAMVNSLRSSVCVEWMLSRWPSSFNPRILKDRIFWWVSSKNLWQLRLEPDEFSDLYQELVPWLVLVASSDVCVCRHDFSKYKLLIWFLVPQSSELVQILIKESARESCWKIPFGFHILTKRCFIHSITIG